MAKNTGYDITGQRFGKLMVLGKVESRGPGRTTWNCRCDCGNEKIIAGVFLVIVSVIAICCSGCQTTSRIVATDESIIASELHAQRIEDANKLAGEQIGLSRAEIEDIESEVRDCRTVASTIGDGIERLAYLFGRYEEILYRIISSLRRSEQGVCSEGRENSSQEPNTVLGGNPFLD